jgi:hypothetical protein
MDAGFRWLLKIVIAIRRLMWFLMCGTYFKAKKGGSPPFFDTLIEGIFLSLKFTPYIRLISG